jgi:hypothetical protein
MTHFFRNCCLLFGSLFFISEKIAAQSSPLPIQSLSNEIVDRLQILSGGEAEMHTDLRPFSRKNAVQLAQKMDSLGSDSMTAATSRDLQYLFNESNEYLNSLELANTLVGKKSTQVIDNQPFASPEAASQASVFYKMRQRPLLRYFYKTPANLLEVNSKYFRFRANPVLNFEFGKSGGDDNRVLFLNRRGIEMRGDIDDRLFFSTSIVENQVGFQTFVNLREAHENLLPGTGGVKVYESRIFKVKNGFDFSQTEARIGFHATHHIGVEFGRGTHFIGNGYRSVLLSDFATPYLFLKFNTQVWRLHYQNIFAELIPSPFVGGTDVLPRKYMAAHYLSLDLTKKWQIGLFETTMLHRSNHFELQYLNPIIFYRTIEAGIGSPDNLLLGLNSRLNLGKTAQLYGQFMLDEFLFKYAILPKKGEKGWWANKYAAQIGAKYINAFGVDHLDLQAELNLARPYTFSHFDSTFSNYANYNLPLAHPLGSNFREILLRLRWNPAGKFGVESKVFLIKNGENAPGKNFGSDLALNYGSREQDFAILLWNLDASYQLFHTGFLDLRGGFRRKKSDDPTLSRTDFWFGGGFRMNIAHWKNEF